jgi:ABC-type uncharacterized transport system substrate-binding protein
MRRREFIALVGGAAAWPHTVRAQKPPLPVIAFIRDGSAEGNARYTAGFRKGLNEAGFVEGQNVTVEYHWLEGKYDGVPALLADLVRRNVAVIATPGNVPSRAAKAATTAIPIVFGVGDDPVQLGLVASIARPNGNLTGINFQTSEVVAKRLLLLHEMVPKAVRIAVLVNPKNASVADYMVREVQKATPTIGLRVQVFNASTIGEIDAAFATMGRERADALIVSPEAFFASRRVQIVTLAARDRMPAMYTNRDYVDVGGLTSYGVDLADVIRLIGVYCGRVLKGAKPSELPVLQPTKFEFVINLATANAIGLTIPAGVMSITDEVIE